MSKTSKTRKTNELRVFLSTFHVKEFEERMKSKGYQVLKGRGISFTDEKGVKVKGSEVGFPLLRIHSALEQKNLLQQPIKPAETANSHNRETRDNQLQKNEHQSVRNPQAKQTPVTESSLSAGLHLLLKPEKEPLAFTLGWFKKKHTKQNNRPHL